MPLLPEIFSEPVGNEWIQGDCILNEQAQFTANQAIFYSIPTSAIRINVPNIPQHDDFSCGAAVMASVISYYGLAEGDPADIEKNCIKVCKTTTEEGTSFENLENAARTFGLRVVASAKEMTLEALKGYLDSKYPVICAIQAWGEDHHRDYAKDESGHYVVAIGYDDANIYFQDPVIEHSRGYMPFSVFEKRWHDQEETGPRYNHWGLVLTGPTQKADPIE